MCVTLLAPAAEIVLLPIRFHLFGTLSPSLMCPVLPDLGAMRPEGGDFHRFPYAALKGFKRVRTPTGGIIGLNLQRLPTGCWESELVCVLMLNRDGLPSLCKASACLACVTPQHDLAFLVVALEQTR